MFVLCIAPSAIAQSSTTDFVLIRRSVSVETVRLVSLDEQSLVHLSEERGYETVKLDDCIALINPKAAAPARIGGLLTLTDGQRLPGEAIQNVRPQNEALAWNHPWLGRLEVPLRLIESVAFSVDAAPPAPGAADVVLLANGDRQEGFVVALGNPVSIEVERGGQRPAEIVEIPLKLVKAVRMVAARQAPADPQTRRVWFSEGTVLDMPWITVHESGTVRLGGSSLAAGTPSAQVSLSQIAAILLDADAMVPLAALSPLRVEGPATRYWIPKPRIVDASAPLGLSVIELSGPVVVRYAVPADCERLGCQIELPRESRDLGDCDVIVRSDDDEVFRARLNAANPVVNLNVLVRGGELTIEIAQGANGPIQDRVLLHRAMLLKRR